MALRTETLYWCRIDVIGLERMVLAVDELGVHATSTILSAGDRSFRIDHRWSLSPEWRAQRLDVAKWGVDGYSNLTLERAGNSWLVDGFRRPDLDGADEPDLSATPFCNTLPILRMAPNAGATLTLDTCYVDAAAMTIVRSRQRYDRLGPTTLRYIDLGTSAGFEADLEVDDRGLVLSYEHLFHRVEAS